MDEQRTAFKVCPLLDRRQLGAGSLRSVAVDDSGKKLYLGLEDGVLEEHSITPSESDAVNASLTARKHVCKKAILAVVHLGGAANSLAVLIDDGGLHLLHCESLKAQVLPFRHVVAICADARPGQPPMLALALKPSKRIIRVEVYEVPVVGDAWGRRAPSAQADVSDSSAVKGMAWVGPNLVICTGLKYVMVAPGKQGGQWRELFGVPEDLAYSPVMIQPIPQLAQAMLIVGPAGILIDASGSPVGSALRLDGLATPRALAASGTYLLAACEDAIHVFDCGSGGEVQLLEYGSGLRPAPGQQMFAGDNPSGSCVVVAGRQLVWACLPVSLEEQAREVLQRREYVKAGELIERGLRQGEGWAEAASAQAALCMLHDCEFEAAAGALELCSPQAFQPVQLFPLFPEHTQPWRAQIPAPKRYWGLSPPLQSLDTLIGRKLSSATAALSPAVSSSGISLASSSGREGRANGVQQQPQGPPHGMQPDQQQQQLGKPAAPARQAGDSEVEAEQLRRQALQSLVQYLFRVRMMEGVVCLEGVDTLLLQLLVDLGAVRQVAAFVAVPNKADAQAVGARLQAKGWHHALATLRASRGDAESALHIWRQLVEGELVPGEDEDGTHDSAVQEAEKKEALESAAALLCDPHTSPDAAVLSSLPWLLPASPATALSILTSRSLDPRAVLTVLPPDSEVRLQYLDHLVTCMMLKERLGEGSGAWNSSSRPGSSLPAAALSHPPLSAQGHPATLPLSPALCGEFAKLLQGLSPKTRGEIHTELATQLVAVILRQQPELRSAQTISKRLPPPRSLGPLAKGINPLAVAKAVAGSSGGGGPGNKQEKAGSSSSSRTGSRRVSAVHSVCSTAALVSRGVTEEDGAAATAAGAAVVLRLRLRLRRHLEESGEYDRESVLAVMAGTGLHEELVVLHSQMGDHLSALRVLALVLRDIAAAEAYAITHLPPSEYRTLLHVVLNPGPGIEPLFDDAAYLVTALGDHLDPMDVVQTLPPSMPLAAAAAIVAPILRDRIHRRRQGAMVKNLHRSQLMSARGEKCDVESARVVVDDERACPGCHLRIGGKVFVVMQPQQDEEDGGGQAGEGRLEVGAAARGGVGAGSAGSSRGGKALPQQAQQQRVEGAGRELRVVCYNCYRRMAGKAGAQGGSRTLSGSLDFM